MSRQHPRFSLRLPLLCESPVVPGYYAAGFTQDVSRGGLLLQIREALAPGTRLRLLLLIDDRIAPAEVVVVWMEDRPKRMGVRFTALASGDRLSWDRLLTHQEGPRPRASVRIPVDLQVRCLISWKTPLSGRLRNLSDGGLMISVGQNLFARTRLSVTIPQVRSLPPVEVEGEVVWTQAARKRPGMDHGLRYVSDGITKELFVTGALLRQLLTTDEMSPGRGTVLLAILARESLGSMAPSGTLPH